MTLVLAFILTNRLILLSWNSLSICFAVTKVSYQRLSSHVLCQGFILPYIVCSTFTSSFFCIDSLSQVAFASWNCEILPLKMRLMIVCPCYVTASADVGFAIYDRYAAEQMGPPVSYVAHLTGALAGLTIGLLVLKNFEQRLHEQLLWWVALGVYAACTIFAVMYNLMHPDYPWREVSFAYGIPRKT